MKGIELKKILRDSGFSISQIARTLETSQQNLNSALSAEDVKSGTIEKQGSGTYGKVKDET